MMSLRTKKILLFLGLTFPLNWSMVYSKITNETEFC